MINGKALTRGRHLESLAVAAKRYTLQEIVDLADAISDELTLTVEDLNSIFENGGTSSGGASSGGISYAESSLSLSNRISLFSDDDFNYILNDYSVFTDEDLIYILSGDTSDGTLSDDDLSYIFSNDKSELARFFGFDFDINAVTPTVEEEIIDPLRQIDLISCDSNQFDRRALLTEAYNQQVNGYNWADSLDELIEISDENSIFSTNPDDYSYGYRFNVSGYIVGIWNNPYATHDWYPEWGHYYDNIGVGEKTFKALNGPDEFIHYIHYDDGIPVLIHYSLCKSRTPPDDVIAKLGKWQFCICSQNSEDVDYVFPELSIESMVADQVDFYIQMVRFIEYENLTLNTGDVVRPLPFRPPSTDRYGNIEYPAKCGGILAIKVHGTLTFNGGHIDLSGCGIPQELADYRPITPQEQDDDLDSLIADNRLLLNVGDGAAIIIAKNIVVTDNSSRIGNFRITNSIDDNLDNLSFVGGSNILIICENFTNFNSSLIVTANSQGNGKGLSRCFISAQNFI